MLKDDGYPKPDYYFYKKYYDKKRDTTSFVMCINKLQKYTLHNLCNMLYL